MSNGKLEEFKAYQNALELYDMVVHDLSHSMQDRRLDRLVRQQLASADSICSNIEEGYGRESSIEYRRFLIIARGSLRETMGRYKRLRYWLPEEIIDKRIELAEEINRMLSATIKQLGSKGAVARGK
jgi:four helix bundle protein